MSPHTWTIHAGTEQLRIPRAWTSFTWHGRTYRVRDRVVEVYDRTRATWLPSIRLTTSAPKGQVAA